MLNAADFMPTIKICNLNLLSWKAGQRHTLAGRIIAQNLAVFDGANSNKFSSDYDILHEISVYAEKCRHIPALDFKSMCLQQ